MPAAMTLALADRRRAASALRRARDSIAARANSALSSRYPAWCGQGEADDSAAAALDAARHLDFLAGALEAGEAAPFVDYVAWVKSMLLARGVPSEVIVEALDLIRPGALASGDPAARIAIDDLLRVGSERAAAPEGPDNQPWAAPPAVADPAFLSAILSGNRRSAVALAKTALRAAARPTDVYVDLFQRALEEIGTRWQRNETSVAQEHLATTTVQFVLAQVYAGIDRSAPTRGPALITGVEGELHQVGANLVADILEADGWQVRFLGTNMPHEGIVEAALEMNAELVGVSATMLFNVEAVGRLVESLRHATGNNSPRILVGGSAFRSAPRLWREVGADDFAVDLREVCAAARGEEHRAG